MYYVIVFLLNQLQEPLQLSCSSIIVFLFRQCHDLQSSYYNILYSPLPNYHFRAICTDFVAVIVFPQSVLCNWIVLLLQWRPTCRCSEPWRSPCPMSTLATLCMPSTSTSPAGTNISSSCSTPSPHARIRSASCQSSPTAARTCSLWVVGVRVRNLLPPGPLPSPLQTCHPKRKR